MVFGRGFSTLGLLLRHTFNLRSDIGILLRILDDNIMKNEDVYLIYLYYLIQEVSYDKAFFFSIVDTLCLSLNYFL